MKKINKILIAICLVFGMIGCFSADVYAAKTMKLNTKVISNTKVKLSWKKQKGVDGYKIYRSTDEDDNSEFVVLADLSKNKTSFVDKTAKANQCYDYTIHAYCIKNGKEKRKYWACEQIGTSLSGAHFVHSDVYNSMTIDRNSVSFPIGQKGVLVDTLGKYQIKPDGIEVYKKIGKKFKLYKTFKVKKNKANYIFVDKNVKYGKKYQYKFRTYKKINGKIVYNNTSKKMKPLTICVTKNKPSCDFKIIKSYDTVNKEMVIAITNNENEGALKNFNSWAYMYNLDGKYFEVGCTSKSEFIEIAYSYDQVNWKSDIDKCKIKAGETVYFSLRFDGRFAGEYYGHDFFNVNFQYGFYEVELNYNPITGKIKLSN